MKNGIFLASKGQVFGPFEKSAYESMRASGAIAQFTWIWESASASWSPLDPAPTINPEKNAQTVSAPIVPSAPEPASIVAPVAPKEKSLKEVNIATIVHNYKTAMSGQIVKSNELRAVLLSNDETASPQFAINSKVHLNLLDEKSGKSSNTTAVVKSVDRTQGRWEYTLDFTN